MPGKAESQHLTTLYRTAEEAQIKFLVLGLYAFGIKARLPHGSFGPWLRDNAPDLVKQKGKSWEPSSSLGSYMQLTNSLLDAMGIQLSDWFPSLDAGKRKAGLLAPKGMDWQPHQLLLFPEAELDAAQRKLRDRMHEVIAGKSTRMLVAKYVTAKTEADGTIVATTGAGVYHPTKKDGTERAHKRTYEQKAADEAAVCLTAMKSQLNQWLTPAAQQHYPRHAKLRGECRLLANDLAKLLAD